MQPEHPFGGHCQASEQSSNFGALKISEGTLWNKTVWEDVSKLSPERLVLRFKAHPAYMVMLYAADKQASTIARALEPIAEIEELARDVSTSDSVLLSSVLQVFAEGEREEKIACLHKLHKRLCHRTPERMRQLLFSGWCSSRLSRPCADSL
jgi:hypothetical protein